MTYFTRRTGCAAWDGCSDRPSPLGYTPSERAFRLQPDWQSPFASPLVSVPLLRPRITHQPTQMTTPDEGYQPMASAPRDRSYIIIKLTEHRSHRRKHWEHVVSWNARGINPHWRSVTVDGMIIKDSDCVGWRPLDEEAWRVVQQSRDRKAGRRPTAT